jgi:CheY-like chemotaxis protein
MQYCVRTQRHGELGCRSEPRFSSLLVDEVAVSAAHFSIKRLARLEVDSVHAALAWFSARPSCFRAPVASPSPLLARRALFSCMVDLALPIPLDLLGVRSLLLIDDEPAVLRSMSRVLRQAAPDLRILLAEGASEGLAQFVALKPSAILVDARMPDMTGVELCARVHATPASQPVTVTAMTAEPSARLAAAFTRAGAIAVLEKPVDAPALFEVLSAHLVPNSAGDW